ncbi:hypothetical protein I0Q12_18485, partial [Rhodococcus sp. CX]|nr:hypothetical protein [Rhodococcus sp. CX]
HGVEPIKKLSADGVETTLRFGKTGSPTDVDVDADGNVYITNFNADSFTDNIACLDRNGNASRVPFRELSVLRPIGIAVDHLGGITVLDWLGVVYRLDKTNAATPPTAATQS